MRVSRRTARQEYLTKRHEELDASPLMTKKFPSLKSLKVTLDFFDASGKTRNGGMKCRMNLEHAKCLLWFACPGAECIGGDFNLTEAVATAVAGRRKVVTGELHCPGTRKRGDREVVPCRTLLRFKMNLDYD